MKTPSSNAKTPGSRVIRRESLEHANVVSLTALAAERAHLPPQAHNAAPSMGDEAQRTNVFEAGRTAGYQSGLADGLAIVEQERRTQLREAGARLARITDEFGAQARGIDAAFADEVVAIALTIARQVVRHELRSNTARIRSVVQEAMQALNAGTATVELSVHPSDAELLRELAAEPAFAHRLRLIPDERIAIGGCRAVAGPASVDATVETCWRNAIAQLGRDEDWAEGERVAAERAAAERVAAAQAAAARTAAPQASSTRDAQARTEHTPSSGDASSSESDA